MKEILIREAENGFIVESNWGSDFETTHVFMSMQEVQKFLADAFAPSLEVK